MPNDSWYLRLSSGDVFGPADTRSLVAWAAEGRIVPGNMISENRNDWVPAEDLELLGMDWIVTLSDGKKYGPIHFDAVAELLKNESISLDSVIENHRTGERLTVSAGIEAASSRPSAPLVSVEPLEKEESLAGKTFETLLLRMRDGEGRHKNEIKVFESRVSGLEGELSAERSARGVAEAALEEARSRCVAFESRASGLEGELSAERSTRGAAEAALEEARSRCVALESRASGLEGEFLAERSARGVAEAALEEEGLRHNEREQMFLREQKERQQEIQGLHERIQDLEVEQAELRSHLEILMREVVEPDEVPCDNVGFSDLDDSFTEVRSALQRAADNLGKALGVSKTQVNAGNSSERS